jgi:hypothetical protein
LKEDFKGFFFINTYTIDFPYSDPRTMILINLPLDYVRKVYVDLNFSGPMVLKRTF